MTLQAINDVKIAGKTAIPTGLYEVEKYFSPDHNAWVPTLMKVLGFGYVEIHKGNFQKDTKGCFLLGTDKGVDEVLNSADAIHNFYPQVFAALKRGEGVWITFL